MEWWQLALLIFVVGVATLVVAVFVVWRVASGRTKTLARRIGRLSWRNRFDLVKRIWRDERVPSTVRIVLPLLVVYLALPLDLVPDFVPVIGQLDDILVLVVGLGLLLRLVPQRVLDEHLAELEPTIVTKDRERLQHGAG